MVVALDADAGAMGGGADNKIGVVACEGIEGIVAEVDAVVDRTSAALLALLLSACLLRLRCLSASPARNLNPTYLPAPDAYCHDENQASDAGERGDQVRRPYAFSSVVEVIVIWLGHHHACTCGSEAI